MIPMTNTAAYRRRPTGFQEIGQVEHNFSLADHINDDDVADSTDLQRFVQSLSKILGATKFGLTFEFQNLRFHPSKAPRPILQDVSGCINAGSLWGVMGASGAGKCESIREISINTVVTNLSSYFCECFDGKTSWDYWYYQGQWSGW
jgi:ABC-type multidrug transport system fused ATPase/permease subunit